MCREDLYKCSTLQRFHLRSMPFRQHCVIQHRGHVIKARLLFVFTKRHPYTTLVNLFLMFSLLVAFHDELKNGIPSRNG